MLTRLLLGATRVVATAFGALILSAQPGLAQQRGLAPYGPKRLITEAIKDPRVGIVLLREQALGETIRKKLDSVSAPSTDVARAAAAHFITEQRLSELSVKGILRRGESRSIPNVIYVAGVQGGLVHVHRERKIVLLDNSDRTVVEPEAYESPRFIGRHAQWLALITPVLTGDELRNASKAGALFRALRENGVFQENLFVLYGDGRAAFPLVSDLESGDNGTFSIDVSLLTDIQLILNSTKRAADGSMMLSNVELVRSRVATRTAKDIVTLLGSK